jgi:hypothetical protein
VLPAEAYPITEVRRGGPQRVALTESGSVVYLTKLDELAREINDGHRRCLEAMGNAIAVAVEVGGRLREAKESMKHGEWIPWVEANCDFGRRQASNYMRVHNERSLLAEIQMGTGNSHLSLTGFVRIIAEAEAEARAEAEAERKDDDRADLDDGSAALAETHEEADGEAGRDGDRAAGSTASPEAGETFDLNGEDDESETSGGTLESMGDEPGGGEAAGDDREEQRGRARRARCSRQLGESADGAQSAPAAASAGRDEAFILERPPIGFTLRTLDGFRPKTGSCVEKIAISKAGGKVRLEVDLTDHNSVAFDFPPQLAVDLGVELAAAADPE